MRLAIQRRVNSRERKLRILPVILPGGQRAKESNVPGFLQGTTWVEFRQTMDDEDAWHRLECGIRSIPPGRRPGAVIQVGECPYIGLKTFQPEDAPLFFGRAAKIQELVDRLRTNFGTTKEESFLALIGASGSGKSSLALAGLLPAVQRGELPESSKWPLIRFRPGYRLWENLQLALANNRQIASHLVALPALIARPEDEQRRLHLTVHLALHDKPESHRVFVLIDQFEEIFTLCSDEAARSCLIDNLLYATNVADGRTIVVLTMRADFYGQCANYPGLRVAIADHQSLIGPLTEEELCEVIQTPTQLAGGELESGLTELLLADMKGQAGALPFLEHALFKLWERRDGRRLKAEAYSEMGRLGGALDAHAEEFFTRTLNPEEQVLCRCLLVDLVHPGEGAADTKKRVSLDDVAPTDAARAVLKKLADARLVTTGRDDRPEAGQAELAHEALISGWRRLGDWVNENREKSRLKERLLDAGREWERSGKREDFLYRGTQLATAEENLHSSGESLPKLGRQFLEASIATRDRERQEKQREQRKRQRLLATASAIFALLAVAASAAAIFGFWQKGEAERQKGVAEREARLAVDAERSAKEQAELARVAKERTSKLASDADVSLARYAREAGNDTQALQHLAQALRLNPSNYTAAAFACAMLTQTKWPRPLGSLMLHGSEVGSAQFSPDGRQIVTASEDGTARVWDAVTGKPISEPMKHGNWVVSAQFSPDGRRVVTASWDGTARLWDPVTGKPLGEPMKHKNFVSSAQFSPDGRRVVTASWDGTARLWDAVTGKPLGEPMGHEGFVSSAQFSPDGRWVATVCWDGTARLWARLWDAVTGTAIGQPMKHGGRVNFAQFSPDGQRIVTASDDDTAQLWDTATGKAIGAPMKHAGAVLYSEFSPEGQRVVTASFDGTAHLWDAWTGNAIGAPMKHAGLVKSAQFSPDGQRVVTASEDGTARLWNALTGEEIGEPMKQGREVNLAQFSLDGQHVVTASKDGTARLWDTLASEEIDEPMKHEGAVFSAEFSPDGQCVVTASEDGTARLWDALTDKETGEPMEHEDEVSSAEFSPDGQRVVTASEDNTARLWDARTGKAAGLPLKHRNWVTFAQFSPDGQRIVTASDDDTAQLWDSLTGNAVGQPMRHQLGLASARFSSDGQRVVTASADGTARLWDALTGKEIGGPMKHEAGLDSAQFSPDSQRVVTASGQTAQLWDAATGKMTGQPMKHGGRVKSAQFSPDAQQVVTASDDRTARLWDALTGKEIGEPMKHGAQVNSAQFSPDGQRVITASSDGARLWDALTGKEIGVAMKHGLVNSAQFSPDGQRVVTASWDKTARLWDVPTTSPKDTVEDVLLLADLAEATGIVTVQTSGQANIPNTLTPEQVNAPREKIRARFAGPYSQLTPLQKCMKWSVSEPRNRTISPFSEITVSEWLENRAKNGTLDGLRTAMRVDPANARLAAHLGRALADHALTKETNADEGRRDRGEADFQTRHALKLAPDNDEVKSLRAQVVKLLQLPE